MIGLVRGLWNVMAPGKVVVGLLALILLQGIGFGVVSWKLSHRTEQLEDMTTLRKEERANHLITKANFRAAMVQAELDQANAIAARETEWRKKSDASETTIRNELGSALAAADAYLARLLAARPGGAGAGSAPGRDEAARAAPVAAEPSGAGGMSVMDESDVRICTVNTVKARGLKALYEGLRAESQRPAKGAE